MNLNIIHCFTDRFIFDVRRHTWCMLLRVTFPVPLNFTWAFGACLMPSQWFAHYFYDFLINFLVICWLVATNSLIFMDKGKNSMGFLKKDFIYLFILERGKGREKHQCVVASCMPPIGNLACNPGMSPDWESNQQNFGSQARLNPLSHTSQG